MTARYAELGARTNFSFLEGVSHPAEIVGRSHELGLAAIGIADRNTLAGCVRALHAAEKLGIPFVLGSRLVLQDGTELLAWPTTRAAYGNLCRLLTRGKRRAPKGECHLGLADVADYAAGLVFAHVPPADTGHDAVPLAARLRELKEALDAPLWLAAAHLYRGDDRRRMGLLDAAARGADVGLLASNDIRYHAAARRPLADVMTCIREKCRLHDAGFRLDANAERHLKAPAEMARLFRGYPHALAATLDVADACAGFSLRQVVYEYPDEPVPPGLTAQAHLEALTLAGAAKHWPGGVRPDIAETIRRELRIIGERDLARYFLTIHDIVAWARAQDPPILCQGRGSAANSAVCYCLGITNVDPSQVSLLFERFLSADPGTPPDIDVDFEHERREEVIQHIYERYGRDRAGIAATVIHYRPRLAIREVGKVMGLSEDVVRRLAGTVWGSFGREIEETRIEQTGMPLADPLLLRTVELANELVGMPRHLSQHVGGFVITRGLLEETVPVGNAAMADRTFIEWDKDDIDRLGIFKMDVLALGMLTALAKGFDLIAQHKGPRFELHSVPREEPEVYRMLQRADSVGVFQVESRAQMNMLPRLKPRRWYDLVIEVAIVRPGPIQGDMVHPYLRRRDGLEKPELPAPKGGDPNQLKEILGRTLGVPLFQEQAMRLALEAAGFTHDEANELRYAMATFRSRGTIGLLEDRLVNGMVRNGYDPDFAGRVFNQIRGFGEYGFPESHAASFAHLVYISSWMKCFHPDVFCAALLNSQPMGFYAPAQLVRDAREHGVEVRPPCVNASDWDCTLEPAGQGHAVRLGLRLVDGIGETAGRWATACRGEAPYRDFEDFQRRTSLDIRALEALAKADAFAALGIDRRAALWRAKAVTASKPLPLFAAGEWRAEAAVRLPSLSDAEQVVEDYRTQRLSLRGHLIQFVREAYTRAGIVTCAAAVGATNKARVRIVGVVLVRQRPGSAKGVMFLTVEDETGIANAVVWPDMMERFRPALMSGRMLMIDGTVERLDKEHAPKALYPTDMPPGPAVPIVHIVVRRIVDVSADLDGLGHRPPTVPIARADEVRRPQYDRHAAHRHPRDVRTVPKSRDFH
jgi:error-prone DNA polymerase